LNSAAHALGSQLPPFDTSLGWNFVSWPALLFAPSMNRWYGHADGSPYVAMWCWFSIEPGLYMLRGYHSLLNAGTLNTPQW
jgi:hypothetical protein